MWRQGVMVTLNANNHATDSELLLSTCSNPACGVLEVFDGEKLPQLPQLELELNTFLSFNHSTKTIHPDNHHQQGDN